MRLFQPIERHSWEKMMNKMKVLAMHTGEKMFNGVAEPV